jgi:nicotinamidase-related amidase
MFRIWQLRKEEGEVASPTDSSLLRILMFIDGIRYSTRKLKSRSLLYFYFFDTSAWNMASTAAATTVAKRAVGKLRPESTAMLLVDIQERFRPLIFRGETVIRTSQYMTSVAKALDIPVVATQQYTKVFGPTVNECFASEEDLEATPIFEKKKFSMCTEEVSEHIAKLNRSSFIIFGIEAHVCVQQTALDLLEQGNDVHIITDGVSSQQPYDREIALQRMSQAGAFLTTAQSAAFMLMQSKSHATYCTFDFSVF